MRIGIIGTGRIANRFVPEAACVSAVEVVSVYNPHADSAKKFAATHGIKAFSDLDAFFDSVDAVYVASPHETHYEYTKAALNVGKHVLCEKPMVFEKVQALELFGLAKNRGVVLMEGLKTAYAPGFAKILELAKNGVVGEIKYIEACFTKLTDESGREYANPKTGGSFTELGTYVILPVLSVFGCEYSDVTFDSILNEKGLDTFTRATIQYEGKFASVICGLGVKSEGRLMISGTKGYILVDAPWWKPTHISVHYEDASKVDTYECEFEGDGLRYEIETFAQTSTQQLEEISVAMSSVMEKFLEGRM